MEMKHKVKKRNPFIEEIKKVVGKDVTVTVFNPSGLEQINGRVVALDYIQRSVVVRTERTKEICVIPRFLYLNYDAEE